MTITAKNVGRIDVWPTNAIAREADTSESKFLGRMTIWKTNAAARAHLTVSGGEGEYVAEAVRFDGAIHLSTNSLTATDNGFVSFVIWQKIGEANANNLLWVSDPGMFGAYFDFAFGPKLDFGSVDGDGNLYAGAYGLDDVIPFDVWTCFIGSRNTQTGDAKLYIGDVDVTTDAYWDEAFNNAFNGRSFLIGGQPDEYKVMSDLSDFRFMPGISLLDGGGDIPLATRRLFIDADGKPVDPSVATAALGAVGAVLLSGDASTYATNLGTGGALSLVTANARGFVEGRNGVGAVNMGNVDVGVTVVSVHNVTDDADITADFETTISVLNQIQQTGATNYTGKNLTVTITGSLTDASTSPSD